MRYFFSSKKDGNVGLHVGDNPLHVKANREGLSAFLAFQKIQFMNQVHGDRIVLIDENTSEAPYCDAMISNSRGIALGVMVADCVPILLWDEVSQSIGVIHAGRTGSALHISTKTVNAMQESFDVRAQNLRVYIGPCIRKCCYEVGKEAIQGLENVLHVKEGRYFLDLAKANKEEFLKVGVKEDSIEDVCVCTCCSKSHFSYRQHKNTGRFAGVIGL